MSADVKVFICYAREDMAFAKQLYQDLQRAGVRPWMDTEDLQPGQNWKHVVSSELQQSSYVLVLLSFHSLTKRGYVRKEMNDALGLMEECPPDKSFLIPVRLEACEPKEEKLRQFQWCDLFESYEKGMNQILKVICPVNRVFLRSDPLVVSEEEYRDVFHLDSHNLPREYIRNEYEDQGNVVLDQTTGLMWQKSGSDMRVNYADAQKYVEGLNRQKFAGYTGWRLPTIPELMSLLEPEEQSNGLYMSPVFGVPERLLYWCWSADRQSEGESGSSGAAWLVNFGGGVNLYGVLSEFYVRVVRSRK